MSVYFDNAATTFPKPECVYRAVERYMRDQGAALGRGSYQSAMEASRLAAECRQRLTRLFDAESADRLAFTFNCTDGLNLLLRGLLQSGDRVVTTTLEHNSVLRPLYYLQQTQQVEVARVSYDRGTGVIDLNELQDQLRAAPTRLVVVNHASNVTGVVQPIEEVSRLAHDVGALVVLDAAQTAGHIPISVQALGVDCLATAGHKGLLGPPGTGAIYVRPGLEDEIHPIRCGGTGTVSESLAQPREMPAKFESGNLNMPGLAGLNAALEWILERGVDRIQQDLDARTTQLRNGLRTAPGLHWLCPHAAQTTGVTSFTIDGVDCREFAGVLDQSFDIQCRAGLHCAPLVTLPSITEAEAGTVRLSPGVFTTDAEVQQVVEATHQVIQGLAAT